MKKIILISFFLLLSLQKVFATTTIRMLPSIIYTQLDGIFTIDVVVEDITNLMAGDIKLSYDKDKIIGENILEGKTFLEKNGGSVFFATEKINNIDGSIDITFAILGGTPAGVSGTGTIFSVSFKAVHSSPTSQITFSLVDLRNTNIESIGVPGENQLPTQVLPILLLHHYTLLTSPPIIAGVPFNLIITAKDITEQVVDTYNGIATLSVDKGTITSTQVSNFVFGVATVTLIFYTAGSITITASDLDKPSKLGTIGLIVLPGTLSQVIIIPEQSPPLTPTTTFNFMAKAYDEFQNEILGLTFLWEVIANCGTITNTGLFTAGTRAGIYSKAIKATTSQDTIILRSGYATVTITSMELDQFVFDYIDEQEAGRRFYITITAKDIYGNTVTTYTGTNSLEDTTLTINPKTTSNFTAGILKNFPVTITQSQQNIKITTQGVGKIGTSNLFILVPASDLYQFRFSPIPSQRINAPFTINITAEDRYGNLNPYNGSAWLNDTTQTIQPTEIRFNNGIWIGSITIKKAGLGIQITVIKDNRIGMSDLFDVLVPKDKNYFQEENGVKLEIGAYSVPEDYILEIDQFSSQDKFEILLANDKFNRDLTIQQIDSSVHKVTSRNSRQEFAFTKKAQVRTTISYYDTDLSGIDETKLKVYYLDVEKDMWVECPSRVYPSINKVTASISQMGIYILAGPVITNNFNDFVVFPNPFKEDRDGSIIEFASLPEDVTIRIYDISGNLVKYVEHQTARWEWIVDIDSGIYIYVVTDKQGKKIIGKIAIIR